MLQLQQLPLAHGASELEAQLCNDIALALVAAQFDTLLLLIQNPLNGDCPPPPQHFKKLHLVCVTSINPPLCASGMKNPVPNPYPRHLIYPSCLVMLTEVQLILPPNVEHGGARCIDSDTVELWWAQTGPLAEPCETPSDRDRPPAPLALNLQQLPN